MEVRGLGMKPINSTRLVCGVCRFLWLSPVALVLFRCIFRRLLVAEVSFFRVGLPLVSLWLRGVWESRPFWPQAPQGQGKGQVPMFVSLPSLPPQLDFPSRTSRAPLPCPDPPPRLRARRPKKRGPRLLGGIRIFKLLIKTNNSRAPAGRSAEIVPIFGPT